ncbi:MAG: hypothetical protein WBZ29_12330 [Methanocella sp.]
MADTDKNAAHGDARAGKVSFPTYRDTRAGKVSQLNEYNACPYIVAGSLCIMEGIKSWVCIRHDRIVSKAHCAECRLVLTRTPSF